MENQEFDIELLEKSWKNMSRLIRMCEAKKYSNL